MVWISEQCLPFHNKRRRLWSWTAWGQATCSYFMGAAFLFEREHEVRQLFAQWSVTPALFISFITLCLAPSQGFTDITSKSHNHPTKEAASSPFCRWGNWRSEKLSSNKNRARLSALSLNLIFFQITLRKVCIIFSLLHRILQLHIQLNFNIHKNWPKKKIP